MSADDAGDVRPAKVPDTVDEYLAGLSPAYRDALERLRRDIRAAAPDAVETIRYRVPTYVLGEALVAFGAAKHHCGLYVMSPPLMQQLAAELEPYDVAGATIRFTVDAPLPAKVVARVVQARIAENAARKRT